jgi:predicted dehydrogenase
VFTPRSLDIDVVADVMIHDLDLLRWMVDAPVATIHAVGVPALTEKVDIASARIEFANGLLWRMSRPAAFRSTRYASCGASTPEGMFRSTA